jgi:hypothetical protein
MPLRDYAPFFATAEVGTMQTAFDFAWQKLAASLGTRISKEQSETLRAKLAECIIISALDIPAEEPEMVADEALRCLNEDHLFNHGIPLIDEGVCSGMPLSPESP